MPVSARAMRAIATGKLRLTRSERANHEWYSRRVRDHTINMPMSRGVDTISDTILGRMATQLHLTGPQLREAIACSFTQEEYDALLDQLFPKEPSPPQPGPGGDRPRRRRDRDRRPPRGDERR